MLLKCLPPILLLVQENIPTAGGSTLSQMWYLSSLKWHCASEAILLLYCNCAANAVLECINKASERWTKHQKTKVKLHKILILVCFVQKFLWFYQEAFWLEVAEAVLQCVYWKHFEQWYHFKMYVVSKSFPPTYIGPVFKNGLGRAKWRGTGVLQDGS